MSSLTIALIVLGCMLGGMALGVLLHSVLPEHHRRDDSKDIMKTAIGMIATLVALVIGLLVSSAKSNFDATNTGLTQGGAKIIMLDHVLSRYGKETKGIRDDLRQATAAGVERIWPAERAKKVDIAGAESATGLSDVYDKLRDLAPKSESQTHLKSQALQLCSDLMQSRWLLIEQSQNELPVVFLMVLAFWLTVLFAGFGLLTPRNATAITALATCAVSMAFAVGLILELNRPLEGNIKVSSAPLQKALTIIGR